MFLTQRLVKFKVQLPDNPCCPVGGAWLCEVYFCQVQGGEECVANSPREIKPPAQLLPH